MVESKKLTEAGEQDEMQERAVKLGFKFTVAQFMFISSEMKKARTNVLKR